MKAEYTDISTLKHVLQTLRNRLIDKKEPSVFYINTAIQAIDEFVLKLED